MVAFRLDQLLDLASCAAAQALAQGDSGAGPHSQKQERQQEG